MVPTLDKTLNKVGVTVDGVGTTPLSGQSIFRPLGDSIKVLVQSQIERGYKEFLSRVSSGRKKTPEQIDAIARGRVWAGSDAQNNGLVDHLGSFDDAVKAAARHANLKDYTVEFVEPELSWVQELVLQMRAGAVRTLFKADRETLALSRVAHKLDPVAREVEHLSRFTEHNHLYAYCFCSAD